jgi:hypothetical protein
MSVALLRSNIETAIVTPDTNGSGGGDVRLSGGREMRFVITAPEYLEAESIGSANSAALLPTSRVLAAGGRLLGLDGATGKT